MSLLGLDLLSEDLSNRNHNLMHYKECKDKDRGKNRASCKQYV